MIFINSFDIRFSWCPNKSSVKDRKQNGVYCRTRFSVSQSCNYFRREGETGFNGNQLTSPSRDSFFLVFLTLTRTNNKDFYSSLAFLPGRLISGNPIQKRRRNSLPAGFGSGTWQINAFRCLLQLKSLNRPCVSRGNALAMTTHWPSPDG